MKKTKILYTRITKKNDEYIMDLKRRCHTSRATCLDEMFSYMRNNMNTTHLAKLIAKRRNEIQEAV